MIEKNYNLGGEQSGHIIFLDYNPTGDGILTSLMLIKVMLEKQKTASSARTVMPQAECEKRRISHIPPLVQIY